MRSIARMAVFGLVLVLGTAGPGALAGAHTWETWSVFSNADRTVQYVIIKETHGGTTEVNLQTHSMISRPSVNSKTMHIVSGNTAFTFYVLGTAAYAALPGAPPLDDIIPSNFIVGTDTSMEYSGTNTATWAPPALPTNGIDGLTRTASLSPLVSAPNFATNFAGVTGCVDVSGTAVLLPGVPEGATGSSPIRVGKLAPDGSSLSITFDTTACTGSFDHKIVYGQRSGFPAKRGGLYSLQGGACAIGTTSPSTWTGTPSAVDGSGLIWFLVVTTDGAGNEGPWGSYNGVNDRNGSGARCSSGVCGATNKSLAQSCGH